jgi:hypothetical protein
VRGMPSARFETNSVDVGVPNVGVSMVGSVKVEGAARITCRC